MTLRTIDIDTETVEGATEDISRTARYARSRRRNAIMTPTRLGSRLSGFGF